MGKIDVKNVGVYENLMSQVNKVYRHVNQGSFETRYRYKEATSRFCKFAADNFRVQKFTNIQPKHIEAYVDHLKASGKSPSTIKTDLAGIRFTHDQAGGKHALPANESLQLERRAFGGVDRAWTDEEYTEAIRLAAEQGNTRVAGILQAAKTMGLRVHEAVRLDDSQLAAGLRTGTLRVKGKGGKIRVIPVDTEARGVIAQLKAYSKPGGKVFVRPGEKAHEVIKGAQNWVDNHRAKFSNRPITIHGLRHQYAKTKFREAMEMFGDEYIARLHVSRLLGHERDEVTRIYLASSKE